MENVALITTDYQDVQVTHRNGSLLKLGAAAAIAATTATVLSLLTSEAFPLDYDSTLVRRVSLCTPNTNGALSIREAVSTEDVMSALAKVHDIILQETVELGEAAQAVLYNRLWDLYE